MPAEPQRRTLLVVDDDSACCRFVASKIHEETCLIPLVADSLAGAAGILSDKAVQVDALLSDLAFEGETSATTSEINDGFDLLAHSAVHRPDIKLYVLSFFSEHPDSHARADALRLKIAGWFPKLHYGGPSFDLPWKKIELDLQGASSAVVGVKGSYSITGFDLYWR